MYRVVMLFMVALLVVGCNNAPEPVANNTPSTDPANKPTKPAVKELTGFEKIDSEFETEIDKAASRTEKGEVIQNYAQQMLDFIAANPDSDKVNDAIEWAARRASGTPLGLQALEMMVEQTPDKDIVMSLVGGLVQSPSEKSEALLRSLIDKTENEKVKAVTSINLVKSFETVDQLSPFTKDPRFVQQFGEDAVAYFEKERGTEHRDELIGILKGVIENHPDVEYGDEGSAADVAKDMLFVFENLSPGAEAMEITGEDLDGVSFNLSDYRGKVVLLDFWGDW